MYLQAPGIVVSVRQHGETGAIVRVLTAEHGLLAGYVRGGRSRRLRPALQPGNGIAAEFRARSESQMPSLVVELAQGRAAMMSEPLSAATIEWTTALVAATLPEHQPYPRIYSALDGMLAAIESAPSVQAWLRALVVFERVVLAELGYGSETDGENRDLIDDLSANGIRLADDVLIDWRRILLAARERLVDRIARAVA